MRADVKQTRFAELFAAALLMLLGNGILANGTYLYAAELFPTRMRSWATSTGHSMNRLGGVIGPALLGFLLASTAASVLDELGVTPNAPTSFLQRMAIVAGWGGLAALSVGLMRRHSCTLEKAGRPHRVA